MSCDLKNINVLKLSIKQFVKISKTDIEKSGLLNYLSETDRSHEDFTDILRLISEAAVLLDDWSCHAFSCVFSEISWRLPDDQLVLIVFALGKMKFVTSEQIATLASISFSYSNTLLSSVAASTVYELSRLQTENYYKKQLQSLVEVLYSLGHEDVAAVLEK